MAWGDIARGEHRRGGIRYPSDLSDTMWVLIAALVPGTRPDGRPRTKSLRDVIGDPLHSVDGLPVAGVAEEFSASADGAGLFLRLARYWSVAGDQRCAGQLGAHSGGPKRYSVTPGSSAI